MSSRAVVCLGIAVAIVSAWAGAAAKESALAFFEKAGLRQQLEAARAADTEMSKQTIRQLVAQMQEQLPKLPAPAMAELERAGTEMIDAVANAYTVDEVLQVYAAPFDRAYPQGFAEEAQMFATPEGQRFVATLNEAIAATYAFRSQRQQAAMNRETQKFVERLKALAVQPQP